MENIENETIGYWGMTIPEIIKLLTSGFYVSVIMLSEMPARHDERYETGIGLFL